MLCKFQVYSKSDSVLHMYSYILFHFRLAQDIEYSSQMNSFKKACMIHETICLLSGSLRKV